MTRRRSILAEAESLVHGARREAYSHPFDDYTRAGYLMAPLLQRYARVAGRSRTLVPVPPEVACSLMLAVKISRECHRHKRDNLTDIAGYAQCLDLIAERRSTIVKRGRK